MGLRKFLQERKRKKLEKRKEELEKKYVKIGITNPDFLKIAINSEIQKNPKIRDKLKRIYKKEERIKDPSLIKEGERRYEDYLFEKEMKKRGYDEGIIKEVMKREPEERKKLLDSMKVKSIKIPHIGYRVNYTKYTKKEEKEGIQPRTYKLLNTKMPKTTFFFLPTKIAEQGYTDKKASKKFEKKYPEFIEEQSKVRKEDVVINPDSVVYYAHTKPVTEADLEAKKRIKKEERKSPIDYLNRFAEERKKIKETTEPLSVQVINFKKVREEYKKKGKEVVFINDPESKDSYMIFEKTKKGKLKPVTIPPEAIKTVDLTRKEIEKRTPAVKKVEEEYINGLIEEIVKEEIEKTAQKEKEYEKHQKKKKKRLFSLFQR